MHMRILLVEDERKISAYVKRGLEESGYAVDPAYTGREALDWAESVPYDLIILDILLPEMDGLSVCRELRRRGDRTPVLLLTARNDIDDRVAGLDAGADDYLIKPFALKELLARMRALTRRTGELPKSAILQFTDLTLDARTRQVRRGGRRIELAAKEFAVLEGLLTVTAVERVTTQKQYENPGRPGAHSPYTLAVERHPHLELQLNQTTIEEQRLLAGWRIYVINLPAASLSLEQAMSYYRDEWLVEHGFHRFKKGSLPALPLFLRLDERIRGLMLLLMVALQALTLLEFVSQRQLKANHETIAGLVPGNPKMKTDHPSAERILAQFEGLHLFIEETETHLNARLIESLTLVQQRLLALLDIPETIYALNFSQPVQKFRDAPFT
jgi:DNA-binding response OmpR family regulator